MIDEKDLKLVYERKPGRPNVYELIEDLKQSGTWRGETLDKLLTELSSALSFTLR